MSLANLPPELLAFIAQRLGPAELRTTVDYLLIWKGWYQAVLPVYLSDLDLSDVCLSYDDLRRLPSKSAPYSELLRKGTKRLSIRLVGHPSKKRAANPFRGMDALEEDIEGCNGQHAESESEGENLRKTNTSEANRDACVEHETYWMAIGPTKTTSQPIERYVWDEEIDRQLVPWMKELNQEHLPRLCGALVDFEDLRELSFSISSEYEGSLGPRWDYLLNSSMSTFISGWPQSLSSLTLDTCGSKIVPHDGDEDASHICALLAGRLDNIQHVRLRMRCICPAVFAISGNIDPKSSRLRTLVIKLSLPFFPAADYENHDGRKEYDADLCDHKVNPTARQPRKCKENPVFDPMIRAAALFALPRVGLEMLRVSYRDPSYSGINLIAADCVNRTHVMDPSEIFTYEDDGKEWMAWEEDDESLLIFQWDDVIFDRIFLE